MNDDITQELAPADDAAAASTQQTPAADDRTPAQAQPAVDPAQQQQPPAEDPDIARAKAMFGGKPTEEAPPAATPAPASTPAASDDVSGTLADHVQQGQTDSDIEFAKRMFGGGGATTEAPVSPGATPPATPKPEISHSMPVKILLDVLHGAAGLPTEVAGGVADAMHGAMSLAGELESYAAKVLPEGTPVGYNPITHKFLYGDDLKNIAAADQTNHLLPEPDSVTGNLVRSVSQFMAGFLTTGAAAGAAGVAGVLPTAVEHIANTALTDFTFFEGKQENLADLAKKYPMLGKVIPDLYTNAFSKDAGSSETMERLKNTGAGALLGVGAEGVLQGLTKTMQFMQKSGGVASYGRIAAKWLGFEADAPKTIQAHEVATLGDPTGDLLAKKVAAADEATAGIKPGDATGQGPGYDINFAAINTSDDVKQTMSMMASREDARIKAGKGGTETWEQTNAKADQLNGYDVLAKRREGQPLNASEIVAGRRMYVASAEKLQQMATIASQSPTPANLFMFERMASIHSLVQKEVLNAGSELGRGLQALKIPIGGSEEMASRIGQLLDDMGGMGGSLDKANKIVKIAATDAGQAGVDKFVQGSFGKSVKDAVDQAFVNGRFGQKTLVVKTVSDFANMAYQMGIRHNAAYISQKLGTENGVAMGEAAAMAHGWVSANSAFFSALRDNLSKAESVGAVLKSPRASIQQVGGVPFELPPIGKISADNFNIRNSSYLGKALNLYNSYTQIWGKGISLVDQYSKMVGYHMELHAQALRQATAESRGVDGATAGTIADRVSELVANPPQNIHLAAVDQATYQTFTGKPAEWLNKAGTLAQDIPIVGRMLLPFKTTPINILTQALEGSPLAPFVSSWKADIASGGARADIAMSKMATGTAIFQMGLDAAMRGIITGRGPQEANERGNWERLGNQSYSMKTPDGKWLAYNRLEPQAYQLGVAADIADAIKRGDETIDDKTFMKVMTGAIFSIANNVASKSYMQGMVEVVKALSGTDGDREKWLKQQVKTIPGTVGGSAVTTAQQVMDPVARTTEGMIDALHSKIPGLSKDLPAQRNLWGEKLDRSSDMGEAYDAISPYWLKTPNPQPIDEELKRLQYFPRMYPHKLRDGGKEVELDGHQYDRFVELAGNGIKDPARGNLGLKDALNQMVEGKGSFGSLYKMHGRLDATDGGDRQKTLIESEIKSYEDLAKSRIIKEDGGLQASIDQAHANNKRAVPVKQRTFSRGSVPLKGD